VHVNPQRADSAKPDSVIVCTQLRIIYRHARIQTHCPRRNTNSERSLLHHLFRHLAKHPIVDFMRAMIYVCLPGPAVSRNEAGSEVHHSAIDSRHLGVGIEDEWRISQNPVGRRIKSEQHGGISVEAKL